MCFGLSARGGDGPSADAPDGPAALATLQREAKSGNATAMLFLADAHRLKAQFLRGNPPPRKMPVFFP
ncbi:MAG: hypothetical protein ACE5KM_09870, partial [Planctomycetaceae bacterium]